ncbi:hypothetical protein C8R44DRAFT_954718 [Mycena epipterygia]|nr:hypothetical protein C8R44DRAFT_954718 [Mycena epipterygia]
MSLAGGGLRVKPRPPHSALMPSSSLVFKIPKPLPSQDLAHVRDATKARLSTNMVFNAVKTPSILQDVIPHILGPQRPRIKKPQLQQRTNPLALSEQEFGAVFVRWGIQSFAFGLNKWYAIILIPRLYPARSYDQLNSGLALSWFGLHSAELSPPAQLPGAMVRSATSVPGSSATPPCAALPALAVVYLYSELSAGRHYKAGSSVDLLGNVLEASFQNTGPTLHRHVFNTSHPAGEHVFDRWRCTTDTARVLKAA